jgi:hypothetical protein
MIKQARIIGDPEREDAADLETKAGMVVGAIQKQSLPAGQEKGDEQ